MFLQNDSPSLQLPSLADQSLHVLVNNGPFISWRNATPVYQIVPGAIVRIGEDFEFIGDGSPPVPDSQLEIGAHAMIADLPDGSAEMSLSCFQ